MPYKRSVKSGTLGQITLCPSMPREEFDRIGATPTLKTMRLIKMTFATPKGNGHTRTEGTVSSEQCQISTPPSVALLLRPPQLV